jgi:O-antigen/teichoic acid export membrane protein
MNNEIKGELNIVSKYVGISALYFGVGYPMSTIIGIVIAKTVGAENLGIISLYLSFMQLLTFVSLFGTDRGSIKYIAHYIGLENFFGIKRTIFFALIFPLCSMGLVLGIYFAFDSFILSFLFPNAPELKNILRTFIFFLPIFVFKQSIIGILRGLQRPQYDRVEQTVIYPIIRISLLFLFIIIFNLFLSLFLATVLATAIGLIYMFIKVKKEVRLLNWVSSTKDVNLKLNEYLLFSLPLILVPLINVATSSLDSLIISQYLDATNIGIYSIIKRFGLLVSIPLSLVSPMIASTVAKMYSKSKLGDFKTIYVFATKWSVFISSVLFCIIFIYSEDLLLILGEDFSSGNIPLKIFAFSQLIVVFVGPIGNVLIMANKKNYFIIYSYISILIGFGSIYYLTPTLGLLGATISISLIFILVSLLCLITLIHSYKIFPMSAIHLLYRIGVITITILIHYLLFDKLKFLFDFKIVNIILGSILIFINIAIYYFFIENLEDEDKHIINKITKKVLRK